MKQLSKTNKVLTISDRIFWRVVSSFITMALFAVPTAHSVVYCQTASTTNSVSHQTDEISRWIQQEALPLKSPVAGSGFDDLRPLKEVLKDVRIVGLGEATHGTREMFQMKHRLVEFLVRELGFTIFAMEMSHFRCLPLNDYVLRGTERDDPVKIMKATTSGIYQTEEVLELVRWMYAYNKTVPAERKVSFQGFDGQGPQPAVVWLSDYLKKVAPDYLSEIQKVFDETAPKEFRLAWDAYGKRTAEQKARLHDKLLNLLGHIAVNQARFVRLSSPDEFATAMQAARTLVQSDEIRSTPEEQSQTDADPRDRFMAETVEYLLQRRPGAKAILWAHNFHLWTLRPDSGSALDKDIRTELKNNQLLFKTMGSYLRDFFGDKYYTFGFFFDEGSFQAVEDEAGAESIVPLEFTLGPSSVGSGGWQFSQAGIGDFALDFRRKAAQGTATKWFTSPQRFRWAGAEFSKKWAEMDYTLPVVMKETFDGLIFIQKTSRARPLR